MHSSRFDSVAGLPSTARTIPPSESEFADADSRSAAEREEELQIFDLSVGDQLKFLSRDGQIGECFTVRRNAKYLVDVRRTLVERRVG
jgi:hypothetical protein